MARAPTSTSPPTPIFMYGWTSEGKLKAKHEWLCVLASIIQKCKAHNKCFTGSPQDATPVRGAPLQRAHTADLGEEGRAGRKIERKWKAFCISKQTREILKALDPDYFGGNWLSSRQNFIPLVKCEVWLRRFCWRIPKDQKYHLN